MNEHVLRRKEKLENFLLESFGEATTLTHTDTDWQKGVSHVASDRESRDRGRISLPGYGR